MGWLSTVFLIYLCLSFCLFSTTYAGLKYNYYSRICPNVETIVRNTVEQKFNETFVTVPATIRLYFHDCFVQGCDASVMIASTDSNKAEKEHEDNVSLAGDGFDTVIRAKKAVDDNPQCQNRVSCADILAMATRDVIALAGGRKYKVELGRFDGLVSRASDVDGKLPKPEFNLSQLRSMFATNGLTQKDMIALSATHTVGFSHCSKFANRIFNFSSTQPIDPTLNGDYAIQLQQICPIGVDERIAIDMDPTTPRIFDNQYFRNLQQGKGLFSSDQVLFTDRNSRPIVDLWARQSSLFSDAFVAAITKLGRVGVKTRRNGNIRRDCGVFNN